jgi:hypothetical protein
VLGGEVQWTVYDLDGGGGLMANKNKSLASESDGDVFVGTNLCWVTLGGVFHLVLELNYLKKKNLAVRNLKLFYFKNSRLSIFFLIHRSRDFRFFLNRSFPRKLG